jgi:hypothetical protein
MRTGEFVEKRRFKRLDMSLPTELRHFSSEGKEESLEGNTLNVSYNGVYVIDISVKNIKANDTLNISLSVPRDETRDFPFSRIAGKARVARIEKNGVALEFSEDINRLFVAN